MLAPIAVVGVSVAASDGAPRSLEQAHTALEIEAQRLRERLRAAHAHIIKTVVNKLRLWQCEMALERWMAFVDDAQRTDRKALVRSFSERPPLRSSAAKGQERVRARAAAAAPDDGPKLALTDGHRGVLSVDTTRRARSGSHGGGRDRGSSGGGLSPSSARLRELASAHEREPCTPGSGKQRTPGSGKAPTSPQRSAEPRAEPTSAKARKASWRKV